MLNTQIHQRLLEKYNLYQQVSGFINFLRSDRYKKLSYHKTANHYADTLVEEAVSKAVFSDKWDEQAVVEPLHNNDMEASMSVLLSILESHHLGDKCSFYFALQKNSGNVVDEKDWMDLEGWDEKC